MDLTAPRRVNLRIYFSDFFHIDPKQIDVYGAFNISLLNDLPLFIDPFLLFNSKNSEYRTLHDRIIEYVRFLQGVSGMRLSTSLVKNWFVFPEVKQNWLGYSRIGNRGRGLGTQFGQSLNRNLDKVFRDFGREQITRGAHLEKLCLIKDGVGRDQISDFTTNLIKGFLAKYTEAFSKAHIATDKLDQFAVDHCEFNYETKTWITKHFVLPKCGRDYVLLTPIDLLTKDEAWINHRELVEDFSRIANSLPNDQLRQQIDRYLAEQLSVDATKEEWKAVIEKALENFPEIIDYYIKQKEDDAHEASVQSLKKVAESRQLFVHQLTEFVSHLFSATQFYRTQGDSYEAAHERIAFLKQVIENEDGYRVFYIDHKAVKREQDLQLLFKLTWHASPLDVNAEVNNGRGPVDFAISRGSADKTLVEFKLASNTHLKQNLQKQVPIYETAAKSTKPSIKVILFFSDSELQRVQRILKELKLQGHKDVVLIDARGRKKSASKA